MNRINSTSLNYFEWFPCQFHHYFLSAYLKFRIWKSLSFISKWTCLKLIISFIRQCFSYLKYLNVLGIKRKRQILFVLLDKEKISVNRHKQSPEQMSTTFSSDFFMSNNIFLYIIKLSNRFIITLFILTRRISVTFYDKSQM